MVSLRYKPLKDGNFSVYLDICYKTASGKSQRKYEFLDIRVSKDYSDANRVKEADRENLEKARAVKARREIEIVNGRYGFEQNRLKSDESFLTFLEAEVKRKATNRDYNQSLLKHVKGFLNGKPLLFADVNRDWCEDFKQYLLRQVIPNTARGYLQALKLFLNIAIDKNYLVANPMQKVALPKMQEVRRTTLDVDELKLLMATPTNFGHQVREAFFFACFTGMRISDVRLVKWSDIANDTITYRPAKTPNKLVRVPVSAQARLILDSIDRDPNSDLIFSQLTIHKNTLADHLRTWAEKAGLGQRLHFHASRHTFATLAISYDMDLLTVKELLGHAKIDMTLKYAKLVDKKRTSEMSKMPTLS